MWFCFYMDFDTKSGLGRPEPESQQGLLSGITFISESWNK